MGRPSQGAPFIARFFTRSQIFSARDSFKIRAIAHSKALTFRTSATRSNVWPNETLSWVTFCTSSKMALCIWSPWRVRDRRTKNMRWKVSVPTAIAALWVPGRFEAADHRLGQTPAESDQPVMLCAGMRTGSRRRRLWPVASIKTSWRTFIDRHQHRIGGYNILAGHGRSLRNGL